MQYNKYSWVTHTGHRDCLLRVHIVTVLQIPPCNRSLEFHIITVLSYHWETGCHMRCETLWHKYNQFTLSLATVLEELFEIQLKDILKVLHISFNSHEWWGHTMWIAIKSKLESLSEAAEQEWFQRANSLYFRLLSQQNSLVPHEILFQDSHPYRQDLILKKNFQNVFHTWILPQVFTQMNGIHTQLYLF